METPFVTAIQQYEKELIDFSAVSRLYEHNDMLWLDSKQRNNQAFDALDFIVSASRHGLNADDYHLTTLKQLDPSQDDKTAEYFEVLLTDGLLALIHDLAVGKLIANEVDPQWFIPQDLFDSVSFLQQALLSPYLKNQLDSLFPKTHDYRQLIAALARYQNYVDRGGWEYISSMPLIRPGDSHQNIPLIRMRLALEDKLFFIQESTSNSEEYDELTEQAVRRFQKHHALKIDGAIGTETLYEMNVSAEDRVKQIKVALERQRWLPTDLGKRYVIINLANYTLRAVDDNVEKLAMRVIVGKVDRPTPSFAGGIATLVVNPYWTVPYKIAVLDLLPKQKADFNYFYLHDIRVFSTESGQRVEKDPYLIDWQSLSKRNFPYTLRQEPGLHNALGSIKFLFPNPWAIYLHDSPHKELFDKAKRNFSSGCIRVEDPRGFAEFMLTDSNDHQRLSDILLNKENKGLKLAEPLPIYAVYVTVSIVGDEVIFSPDSYKRDQKIAEKL